MFCPVWPSDREGLIIKVYLGDLRCAGIGGGVATLLDHFAAMVFLGICEKNSRWESGVTATWGVLPNALHRSFSTAISSSTHFFSYSSPSFSQGRECGDCACGLEASKTGARLQGFIPSRWVAPFCVTYCWATSCFKTV